MKDLTRILYADDEQDMQTIVEIIVQSTGDCDIKICDNGKQLLDCVEYYEPDLILLDVMMPEMDGLTTFMNLQADENTKNIPVIFMSAKAQIHEVNIFQNRGVIGVITKPFDPLQFFPDLKKIWEKSNKIREN